jgi:hypothetical protein
MTEFPYVNRRGQYYPIIPVTLRHGNCEIRTEALVDSGASISTFQGDLAHVLGLALESGEKIYLQGNRGPSARIRSRGTTAGGRRTNAMQNRFSNELISSVNLLGRADFFEHFFVSFDERNKKLFLKPYS